MGKNPDPGSGINIPDPQHWLQEIILYKAGEKRSYLLSR
jgi:hypothetical protein